MPAFAKKRATKKPRASRESPGHEDLYTPNQRSGKNRLHNEKVPLPGQLRFSFFSGEILTNTRLLGQMSSSEKSEGTEVRSLEKC